MPREDGTGPEGMGPKTGRGAGPCADDDVRGSRRAGSNAGTGKGFGRGAGRRWRNRFRLRGLAAWMPAGPRRDAVEEEQE